MWAEVAELKQLVEENHGPCATAARRHQVSKSGQAGLAASRPAAFDRLLL